MEGEFFKSVSSWLYLQGMPVIIIVGIAYFFYKETTKLTKKVDDLNNQMIHFFEKDRRNQYKIIEENSGVLRQCAEMMLLLKNKIRL